MGSEEQTAALDAARACVIRASEEVGSLLAALARARAAIENAPERANLDGAVAELLKAQRSADGAVRAAKQRVEHAAAVVGVRLGQEPEGSGDGSR